MLYMNDYFDKYVIHQVSEKQLKKPIALSVKGFEHQLNGGCQKGTEKIP